MLITNIINDSLEKINEYLKTNKKIAHKDIIKISKTIYDDLSKSHKSIVSFDLLYSIVNKLFKSKYKIVNSELDLQFLREHEILFPKVKTPKEYKKLQEQFDKLKNLPQPEQRTKEWFDYRHNRITASDTASAIDENPYEPVESFILKKCDPEHKFLDNANVYHGKKYEPIATLIYEHIYNSKVTEFGALPSDRYQILGASPDGICSNQTLDYKFSNMLGTMLEIKCTVMRQIYTSGKIAGHICPFYYYCQVQQQLECCDLDKCDFWQCKISEYKNRTAYFVDDCNNTEHTIGTNSEKVEIDNSIKKGIILKFLPKVWTPEFDGDIIEWKSKFLYPPKLNMDEIEYDNWVVNTLSNWQTTYPELASQCYFEKVVYWKLEASHNVVIDRDIKFFQNILPILNDTWSKVLYYRQNISKLSELRDIIKARTKFQKFNTKININNDLVDKKVLFLNSPVKNLEINSFDDGEFLD